MVNVTEAALEELKSFFKDKELSPVRIYLQSGCGGAMLRLAMDPAGEDDQTVDVEGFTFVMEKELAEKMNPVDIDFMEYGFKVTSEGLAEMQTSGCSGCSGGCS